MSSCLQLTRYSMDGRMNLLTITFQGHHTFAASSFLPPPFRSAFHCSMLITGSLGTNRNKAAAEFQYGLCNFAEDLILHKPEVPFSICYRDQTHFLCFQLTPAQVIPPTNKRARSQPCVCPSGISM